MTQGATTMEAHDDPTTPGIPRRLRLAGLALALAAAIIIALAPTITSRGGTVPIVLSDADLARAAAARGLPVGTTLDGGGGDSEFRLVVDELPLGLSLLTAAGPALAGAIVVIGGWLLIWILLDIRRGQPFSPANPRRLAALAVAVLAAALLPQLVENLAAALVLDHLGVMGSAVPEGYSTIGYTIVSFDAASVLLVVAIAIMAEAFRHGQRLAADVDGLV